LAAPELLRRAFRQAPEEVWRLLRQDDRLRARHTWLTELHLEPAQVPRPRGVGDVPRQLTGAGEEPAQLVEKLTEKELEVLGHLSDLLTTEEIAAAMFISVNTVRTHVRHVLRKLAATRRNEAVRRARHLRLLPG
jgi:LuxR family maltose regulon positive regulatory protein